MRISNAVERDEHREGRSTTPKMAESIDAVRERIQMDRYVTYRKIQSSCENNYRDFVWKCEWSQAVLSLDPTQFDGRPNKGSRQMVQGNAEENST